MSDTLAARIRTVWVLFVGHAAALVAVWLATRMGLTPGLSGTVEVIVAEGIGLAASWLVWELGHWLEKQANPTLVMLGRWVLAAGKQIGPPSYLNQQPPAPDGAE